MSPGKRVGLDPRARIGVFDSGLGGLTVARAIRHALPQEALVYLGDTARVPYGTRSAQTVLRYARTCASRLARHEIKLLVVACNTVSAVALDFLRVELDIPVLGVIDPGARAGVAASSRGRIGVLATAGTVASGAYEQAIARTDSRAEVLTQAAPLLVPLAEEGWTQGDVPRLVARRYLKSLACRGMDTLVLGCTHYPVLRDALEAECTGLAGAPVPVVDSAAATAQQLEETLRARGLAASGAPGEPLRLLVTDLPQRFAEIATRFLGHSLHGIPMEAIDL